jgi:hypothetical protein
MRFWIRRHLRLLIVLLVVFDTVAIFLGATYKLFVAPHEDPVRKSDAVVVIAGGPLRMQRALQLVDQGAAPLLLISDPGGRWPYGSFSIHTCKLKRAYFQVLCFHPNPESTQGEARAVKRIAAQRHLRSLIVVTSNFHVTRARLEMGRCFHGRLAVIGTPWPNPWKRWRYTALEWPKLAYAETLNRGC